jgi:hypothetical protein
VTTGLAHLISRGEEKLLKSPSASERGERPCPASSEVDLSFHCPTSEDAAIADHAADLIDGDFGSL